MFEKYCKWVDLVAWIGLGGLFVCCGVNYKIVNITFCSLNYRVVCSIFVLIIASLALFFEGMPLILKMNFLCFLFSSFAFLCVCSVSNSFNLSFALLEFCFLACIYKFLIVVFCYVCFFFYYLINYHQPSRFIELGVSARPFTLSRSAVLRNAGSCSWDTFTSPAYMNSNIACRCM